MQAIMRPRAAALIVVMVVMVMLTLNMNMTPRSTSPLLVISYLWKAKSEQDEPRRDMVARFQTRRQRVSDTCRKYGDKAAPEWIHKNFSLYYNQEYNLMACLVQKAGSSTWRAHFEKMIMKNTSRKVTLQDIRATNILGTDNIDSHLHNATSLMVTRHPLERLVSAYHEFFLKRSRIISEYTYRKYLRKRAEQLGITKQKPSAVSFAKFLELVLLDNSLEDTDPHWTPAHVLCSPCIASYHYFVRLETIEEDRTFLAHNLLIPELSNNFKRNQVRRNDYAMTGKGTGAVVREKGSKLDSDSLLLYLSVPPALMQRVLSFVALDAELFGYELPPELTRKVPEFPVRLPASGTKATAGSSRNGV